MAVSFESDSPHSLRLRPPPAPSFPLYSLEQPDLTGLEKQPIPLSPLYFGLETVDLEAVLFEHVRSCSRTTFSR